MKKNRETIRSAMDRRLSFLDDLPSCRTGVLEQIAREEVPVMKKSFPAERTLLAPRTGRWRRSMG